MWPWAMSQASLPFRKAQEGAPHPQGIFKRLTPDTINNPEPRYRAHPKGNRHTASTLGSGQGCQCWISLQIPSSVTFHNESNKLVFLSANQSEPVHMATVSSPLQAGLHIETWVCQLPQLRICSYYGFFPLHSQFIILGTVKRKTQESHFRANLLTRETVKRCQQKQ